MDSKEEFIHETGSIIEGHFVYKVGYKHGNLYINKENFWKMGASRLVDLIRNVGREAIMQGLDLGNADYVGIIGPAYGAIPFSLVLAELFEEQFPELLFFPARSELAIKNGRKIHVIPKKLLVEYMNKPFIIIEDIVNNGTTIKEVSELFKKSANAKIIAALCFVDRSGQTAESLGIEQYYPFIRKKLEQFNILEAPCPLCAGGIPITLEPGKGREWANYFGHPPYPREMDFSSFWKK